jgi:NADPH-dependent 2,4-dienoyl-CoA reductase/sulfur reductase-like enzyme
MPTIVIIGAGPAGIRAAETISRAGLVPILIDEAPRAGGQGYRTPASGISIDTHKLMGSQSKKYQQLHHDFLSIVSSINYRPETLVWAIENNTLFTLSHNTIATIQFDCLIVASGATDRVYPMPGWTLPGVFTLGGMQLSLKDQGCAIGKKVVLFGSSPLLPLVALQYKNLGVEIAAICDTTGFAGKISALPSMVFSPGTFLRGLSYLASLTLSRTPLFFGVKPLSIEGDHRVRGIRFLTGSGQEKWIECDGVGLGYGLKPETQIADLAGAVFEPDEDLGLWLPRMDQDGRAGNNLYLAGDGAAIGGADAAEASGKLAALAALSSLGVYCDAKQQTRLQNTVRRLRAFQRGLARAFAPPQQFAETLADETVICRCEAIHAGTIRKALALSHTPPEMNRVKAITRCGMGRCQGRMCAPALQAMIMHHANQSLAQTGRLRGQAPIKPIPLSAAGETAP